MLSAICRKRSSLSKREASVISRALAARLPCSRACDKYRKKKYATTHHVASAIPNNKDERSKLRSFAAKIATTKMTMARKQRETLILELAPEVSLLENPGRSWSTRSMLRSRREISGRSLCLEARVRGYLY